MSCSYLLPHRDYIDNSSKGAELVVYNDRVREANYERVRRNAA